ncbi:bifunctional phosphoribosyl-AMP cyclohydrolase/phosphoribosyl-ATP diphosphatase HisIE [Parvularcula sp. IMCC14364]|uniref:bifunctional phosphoribosyl-AMP cyclohydrolase/phosphoribosyl-ATP diphosphatase HisIE n=1 Tax=Parvularcula sp. IMCC14364 TaxID=3067902 RepID=UPI00274186B9|nr:bifunctional phosphoribosyl-AMP cyclohydrolase/phosphoribosyl-ATP diphosphatase HisIE [Parvularcula sp. IMCC14364]
MRPRDADIDVQGLDWQKSNGLIPAIIQDADTLQVLMLGYMNRESLEKTHASGLVTFFSRSRQALWQKGETSGNTLTVVSVKMDCDKDTLLVLARRNGPVCHLGTRSCFADGEAPGIGFLAELEQVVSDRRSAAPDSSYTAKLFAAGKKRIAQKVGEEGVETALAGAAGDRDELKEEAADLLYHLTVLLQANDMLLSDVLSVLRTRHQKT